MRAGFTLIEVLVAVVILAIIMILVQTTTWQILKAKEEVEARDMVFQRGRAALRKISDDISGGFLLSKSPSLSQTPQITLGQVSPKELKVKTFFRGEERGEQDQLFFTTFSHLRLFQNAKESDEAKVSYTIIPSPDRDRTFQLIRTEIPWLDERLEVEGKGFPIAEGILEFQLDYYDDRKEEWVKEWDTEKIDWKDRLPSAVRITLLFPDPQVEGESIDFTTAVFLPLSRGPIAF